MSDSQPRPRRSLRWKWTLAILIAGGLPLAALAFVTVQVQRRGLESAEQGLQVAVIGQVDEALDRMLGGVVEATHRVGVLLGAGPALPADTRVDLARELVEHVDMLDELALYDGTGRFQDALTRGSTRPTTRPDLELDCEVDAAGRWLAPTPGPGGLRLTYREALVQAGRCTAWLVASIAPGALDRRIGDISQAAFAHRDRVLVLDETLRVLAGDGSRTARDRPFSDGSLFERPLPSGVFSAAFGLTTTYHADDGAEMVATLRSSSDRGWGTLVRRPQAEAYAALTGARRALVAAAIGFALLALVFGALVAARATRPIAELVALTHSYGRREFARRSPVRSGDELELLGEAMGVMASELSASELEIARRAVVQDNLSRYLPAQLATAIADGEANLALGGERRAVSVLFADVVAFTSYAEGQDPARVVAFLNELFTVLSEVVFRHGGTVDKFIGDCVMAVFGAPTPQADHARRALSAAEDMHRFVEATSPTWRDRYGIVVKLAIGMNSGEALVGNLGSELRMDYTAIGDAVNVAARLEKLARPGQTLVTRAVLDEVGADFGFVSLGTHPIRGKTQAIEVFELT